MQKDEWEKKEDIPTIHRLSFIVHRSLLTHTRVLIFGAKYDAVLHVQPPYPPSRAQAETQPVEIQGVASHESFVR